MKKETKGHKGVESSFAEFWCFNAGLTDELSKAVATLDKDPDFQIDYWKSMFVEKVIEAMEEPKVTKKELAHRLGWSAQYVGRILNETANFTIETMVKLALALDRQPYFTLHRNDECVEIVRESMQSKRRPSSSKQLELTLAGFEVIETQPPIMLGGTDAGNSKVGRVPFNEPQRQVA